MEITFALRGQENQFPNGLAFELNQEYKFRFESEINHNLFGQPIYAKPNTPRF
jgi:hypothetical protein